MKRLRCSLAATPSSSRLRVLLLLQVLRYPHSGRLELAGLRRCSQQPADDDTTRGEREKIHLRTTRARTHYGINLPSSAQPTLLVFLFCPSLLDRIVSLCLFFTFFFLKPPRYPSSSRTLPSISAKLPLHHDLAIGRFFYFASCSRAGACRRK